MGRKSIVEELRKERDTASASCLLLIEALEGLMKKHTALLVKQGAPKGGIEFEVRKERAVIDKVRRGH